MAKTYHLITSPVAELPGTVQMPDGLYLPEVVEYSAASRDTEGKDLWERQLVLLPVQIKLTGEWHIDGLPIKPDAATFPFTPAQPATRLLKWLHDEFTALILREREIPNA